MRIKQLLVTSIILITFSMNTHAWWAGSSNSTTKAKPTETKTDAQQRLILQKMQNINIEQYQAQQQYIKEIEAIQTKYRQQAEATRKAYNKEMQQWYIQ